MAEVDSTPSVETTQEADVPRPGSASTGTDALLAPSPSSNLLDWRSGLPDNLRTDATIANYGTAEAAAKALIEQRRMLGRALFVPDGDPESDAYLGAMQKLYDRLGRPKTAGDYTLPIPDGREIDTEIAGRLKADFHQAGLTQAQVQAVMDSYWRSVEYTENARAGAAQQSYQDGRKQLFAEFGASTEHVIAQARGFFEHMGAGAFGGKAGEDAWQEILEAVLPDGRLLRNSPNVLAAFAEAGKRLGEGEWLDSDYYQPGTNTMDTLIARAQALNAKRHGAGLSADEFQELMRVNDAIVRARERGMAGAR